MTKPTNNRTIAAVLPNLQQFIRDSIATAVLKLRRSFVYAKRELIQLTLLINVALSIGMVILCLYLGNYYVEARTRYKQEEEQYSYWRQAIQAHPSYTDAYYEAAKHAVRLSRLQEALDDLNLALYLDPHFTQAQELKKEIEGK